MQSMLTADLLTPQMHLTHVSSPVVFQQPCDTSLRCSLRFMAPNLRVQLAPSMEHPLTKILSNAMLQQAAAMALTWKTATLCALMLAMVFMHKTLMSHAARTTPAIMLSSAAAWWHA